jgi:hypothetical protein
MSEGWENHVEAPLEFFHGKLMDLFHDFRKSKTHDDSINSWADKNVTILIDGGELNNLIAKAKNETYKKYHRLVNDKPVLKAEL